MRPEDVTSSRRIQREVLDKYPALQKATIPTEEVFSNEGLTFQGDGYEKKTYKENADKFVNDLKKRIISDEDFSLDPDKDAKLTPQNLKEYLDKNVTDKALRAEIDGYIKELDAIEDKTKYLEMFGQNDVKDIILQVYVKEELRKAEDELTTYWAMDNTANFTTKLENLRNGKYKDKDGNMKSHGFDKYPSNEYQAYALQVYQEDVIPNEMEIKLRNTLVKLEKEGRLKDIQFDEIILQEAINYKAVTEHKDDMVDKEYDKYVRKHSGLAGITKKHTAVENRRKELEAIKMEDVEKALGKNSKAYKAIKGYVEKNKKEDGTCDISALSDAILAGTGYDFTLSRSKDELRREINNTAVIMVEGLESKNIPPLEGIDVDALAKNKDKIVKELAKFCAFDVEGRDHTPKLWKAVKQTGEAVAVGAATHCIAPNVRTVILDNHVVLDNTTNVINMDGVNLTVHDVIEDFQHIEFDIPMCFGLLQALGTSAVAGLVISVLEDLIFGNDIEFEKTCFNTDDFLHGDPKYTNLENYRKHLQTLDKINGTNTYGRIKFLLDKCEKEAKEKPRTDGRGDWYYEEFLDLLHMVAGLGSNLNCAEIAGAKMYDTKPVEIKPAEFELQKSKVHWETKDAAVDKEEEFDESDLDGDDKIIYNKRAKSSSWKHLANNIYNCGPDGQTLVSLCGGDENKAIRMLKIAQAITDGNYSRQRMEELYNLSLKGSSKLKNIEGLDYGTYYSVLMGNFPPAIKLPKVLCYDVDENGKQIANTGVERCEISDDEHELVAPKATKTKNAPKAAKGPAIGKGKRTVTKDGEKWEQDMYFYKDENGKVHEFDTEAERDAELKEVEERTGKKAVEKKYEEMVGEESSSEE